MRRDSRVLEWLDEAPHADEQDRGARRARRARDRGRGPDDRRGTRRRRSTSWSSSRGARPWAASRPCSASRSTGASPPTSSDPLLAALGLAVIAMGAAQVAHHAVARLEVVSPLVLVVLAAMREGALWSVVALALLLLLFPDGRLPGPRWRAVPPLLVACGVVFQVLGAAGSHALPATPRARPEGPCRAGAAVARVRSRRRRAAGAPPADEPAPGRGGVAVRTTSAR